MDLASEPIFESLFEDSFYFGLDNPAMSDSFMTANTPPYDGSELEDELLLDKFLSDSAMPEDENDESNVTSPSSSVCENEVDTGSQILAKIAISASVQSAKSVGRLPGAMIETHNGKTVSKNKSAIMARENRERKKLYVAGLEESVSQLKNENEHYKSKLDTLQKAVEALSEDAAYLKGVLENQSDLSKILKAVSAVPGITIKPSLRCVDSSRKASQATKRPSKNTEEPQAKSSKMDRDAGICLHIHKGSVSFELCSHCNALSSSEV